MNNTQKWLDRQTRLGWLLLAAGVLAWAAGEVLPMLTGELPFEPRIISGVGILLLGIGVAYLVRSLGLRSDPQAARRSLNAERDERLQAIRARAGHRAFWVSLAMTYAALMWLSFAEWGALPSPSPDALWTFLAAAVVLPFGVYVAGLVMEQNQG